jgi:hypothetical protein
LLGATDGRSVVEASGSAVDPGTDVLETIVEGDWASRLLWELVAGPLEDRDDCGGMSTLEAEDDALVARLENVRDVMLVVSP